jgi:hypothetical protein
VFAGIDARFRTDFRAADAMIAGGELITCDVIEPVCAVDVQQPLSVSNDEGKIGAATTMHCSRIQRGNKVSENAEIYASNDRVSAGRIQVNAAGAATKPWISAERDCDHGEQPCSSQRLRRQFWKLPWRKPQRE